MKDYRLQVKVPLRRPSEVMRLRRMGAAFPTRLSFLRSLLRGLAADKVQVRRLIWKIDDEGHGHAVYGLTYQGYDYALVAVSRHLADDQRTDRVIATAWDTSYVLFDGIPDEEAVARITATAPRQEAARFTHRDLILSRANKSVRLFEHVVAALRAGRQPDMQKIRQTGYLMRTTAVYGNGKFGIADRAHIAERPGLDGPFAAEMLTVWLIRGFTHDLVEHLGGAKLDPAIKRHLGIGNATGLGMAPFLVNHPLLLDRWMQTRETALAKVQAIECLSEVQIARIYELTARAREHLAEWQVDDPIAEERITTLRQEWRTFSATLTPELLTSRQPVKTIINQNSCRSVDTQELIVALMLEPFGELIDTLTHRMATTALPQIDPAMTCRELRRLIARDWEWACEIDYAAPHACAQFWYVSAAKLEPRLGNRHSEDGAARESPLDIARQVKALSKALAGAAQADEPVARFLASNPEHRYAVVRVQTLHEHPYAEIRDNLIGADCLPIDLLRCKLAFLGAAKFDPKSDRWTRITLAQGAPLFDELDEADDWWLPVAPA